jgi:hypothetical protein
MLWFDACVVFDVTKIEYPSGAERATFIAAITPLPPAMFSTKMDCPSALDI